MESQLSPEQQAHLTPLLGSLARLIAQDTPVTDRQVAVLLSATDLEDNAAAEREIKRWARLLQAARDAPDAAERQVVVEGLRLRRLPEAPVLLAVDLVSRPAPIPIPGSERGGPTLRVKPEQLSWSLTDREPAEGVLEVAGGPGQVLVESDQVEVVPLAFGADPTTLQVRVRPLTEGLVWTSLRLVTSSESREVPLIAEWRIATVGADSGVVVDPLPPTPVVQPAARIATPALSATATVTAHLLESVSAGHNRTIESTPIARAPIAMPPTAAVPVVSVAPNVAAPAQAPAQGKPALRVVGGVIAIVCLLVLGGILFGQRSSTGGNGSQFNSGGGSITQGRDPTYTRSATPIAGTGNTGNAVPPTPPLPQAPTATPIPIPTFAPTPPPPAAPPTNTPTPVPAPVTLKMLIVDYIKGKTDQWLENEAIPAYRQSHPNVTIQVIYGDWGTLDKTILGYFNAGQGADILNLGSEYAAQYGDHLAQLNDYLGPDAWPEIRQYLPSSRETVTWNGQMRGLPWQTAPRAYMCRRDIVGNNPVTYQDAINEAGAATILDGTTIRRAGLATPDRLANWQEYIQLIWGLGASLYRTDGTPTFDSAESRAALQFMYDRRRAVFPNAQVKDPTTGGGARLADGTLACFWGNLSSAPGTDDPSWNQIDLTGSPINPDFSASRPVVPIFYDWLGVATYSPHISEAAEFLKFLGSADNQNRYNSDFGAFPPRRDAWTGYVNQPVMQKMGDLMLQYGVGFADVRESAKLHRILGTELTAFFNDKQNMETTIRNIQRDYTQALRDAGRIR